jgi:hypothetical protein
VLSVTGLTQNISWAVAGTAVGTGNNLSQSPAATTTYTVTGQDANGCAGTATVTVTVNPSPSLSLTVTDATVCEGEDATIQVRGTSPGVVYQLTTQTGTPVGAPVTGTGGDISFQIAAGSLTIGTNTFVISATLSPCTVTLTDQAVVTVNPSPLVGLVVDDATICLGETATVTIRNAEPGVTYTLVRNGVVQNFNQTVLGSDIVITIPAGQVEPGTNIFVVRAAAGGLCTQDLLDEARVVVNVPPTVSISASGTQICAGSGTTLTLTASPVPPGFGYQWQRNGADLTGENDKFITVTEALGGGSYNVVVTDLTTSCQRTATVDIEIEVTPLPEVPELAAPDSVCFGERALIQVTNPEAGVTYTLYPSASGGFGIPMPGGEALTPPITVGNTAFFVEAERDGCINTQRGSSTLISVVALPVALFTSEPEAQDSLGTRNFLVLPNADVQFVNTSINYQTLEWFFGDGSSSTQESPTHRYADTGMFVVTLVATNSLGCSDTITLGNYYVKDVFRAYFPSAFTPNQLGPDLNERFYFEPVGMNEFNMVIYNRWGQEVFNNNGDITKYWDGNDLSGTPCPEGVYMFAFVGRNTLMGRTYETSGSITLIR